MNPRSPVADLGRPRVKICGITRASDAVLAVDLGASAIGFVFWPESPRCVAMATARAMTRELPPFVATVGVFVNQPLHEVLDVAAAVPLTVVQFHGDEAADAVLAFPWRLVRAVALEAPGADTRLRELPLSVTILLDAHDPQRRGGTGVATDWTRAARVAAQRRVILAGGLRPDNVAAAIAAVRPWAVDVSSGVEASPGVKAPLKLRAFFDAVGGAAAAPAGDLMAR